MRFSVIHVVGDVELEALERSPGMMGYWRKSDRRVGMRLISPDIALHETVHAWEAAVPDLISAGIGFIRHFSRFNEAHSLNDIGLIKRLCELDDALDEDSVFNKWAKASFPSLATTQSVKTLLQGLTAHTSVEQVRIAALRPYPEEHLGFDLQGKGHIYAGMAYVLKKDDAKVLYGSELLTSGFEALWSPEPEISPELLAFVGGILELYQGVAPPTPYETSRRIERLF